MCNCKISTDFRNTCWLNKAEYRKCPMLLRSILLRISEDYRLNNKIRTYGFDSIKEYIIDTCDITCNDWDTLSILYATCGNICDAIKIQDTIPFTYTPESNNITIKWLH